MSQLPAGPPSGNNNNPSRPSPPVQAAACPLIPFLATAAAGPLPLPTAIIRAGEPVPWPVRSPAATQAFNITGCITDLVINSRNNVEWICPQSVADRTDSPGGPGAVVKMTGQTALMHTWPAGGGADGVTFQRIGPGEGQLRDCIPPQQGQPTLPTPGEKHTCAQCPVSSPIERAPLAQVELGTYYLHGCMSSGDRKVCSWLDLPLGVPCLAREVVWGGFTCDQPSSQSMPTVDVLHSTLMSMRPSGGGTTKDPPVGPVVDAGSPNRPLAPIGNGIEDGAGSRRWVFIAVPLLAFVGGLALGAAFLIYRRRRRTERDEHFSQSVSYTPAPRPTHNNTPQAAITPALAPIPLPTYSSPPIAVHKPIPAPPTSLPRPMDTTGLSLIPLLPVPAAESANTAESLQSLTDAWESLFIRLEHECTQAARAALPGGSIALVRADRNHRMARTMALVWTALSTGASAGEDGGLAEGMRAVMARMSAAYPSFELLGVPGAGVEVRTDAMVEYAAGVTGVGAGRVVKGMVWPGWFDGARQVVVVKARVVME